MNKPTTWSFTVLILISVLGAIPEGATALAETRRTPPTQTLTVEIHEQVGSGPATVDELMLALGAGFSRATAHVEQDDGTCEVVAVLASKSDHPDLTLSFKLSNDAATSRPAIRGEVSSVVVPGKRQRVFRLVRAGRRIEIWVKLVEH